MLRFIRFRNICVSIIVMLKIKVKDTKRSEEESRQKMFWIRLVSFDDMLLTDNAPDRMPLVTSQPPESRALLQWNLMDVRSELRFLFKYFEQTKCHSRFTTSQIINNKVKELIYVKLYPAVRYPFNKPIEKSKELKRILRSK